MRRILFIYGNLNFGGVATLLYRKSKWLIENKYEVNILTTEYGHLKMKNSLLDLGCKLIVSNEINYSPSKISFREMLNFYNKVVNEISCVNEIEFIECFTPLETYYGVFLAGFLNKKLVAGIYHPQSYTFGYTFDNRDYYNLFRNMDKNNCLVFMNDDTMKAHEKYFKYTVRNRCIIPLPINIKKERQNFSRNYEFKILSIGRLCDFKKYVYGLIADFDEFYKTHENSILTIIGDGTEKKQMLKYAKKFKSCKDGKIEFLGTVPYNELDKYIYKASMGVGMGTSLLEMASAGIPAIIAPAFVDNNISNGLLYEADVLNFADEKNKCTNTYKYYMEFIYNCNDEQYNEIGHRCRKVVNDNYSINNIMDQWLKKIGDCNPPVLNEPLDDFIPKSPLKMFLSLEKRKIKHKFKNKL